MWVVQGFSGHVGFFSFNPYLFISFMGAGGGSYEYYTSMGKNLMKKRAYPQLLITHRRNKEALTTQNDGTELSFLFCLRKKSELYTLISPFPVLSRCHKGLGKMEIQREWDKGGFIAPDSPWRPPPTAAVSHLPGWGQR